MSTPWLVLPTPTHSSNPTWLVTHTHTVAGATETHGVAGPGGRHTGSGHTHRQAQAAAGPGRAGPHRGRAGEREARVVPLQAGYGFWLNSPMVWVVPTETIERGLRV